MRQLTVAALMIWGMAVDLLSQGNAVVAGSRLQHQKKLKFIHITKTGGKSIERIGIQYGKLWGQLHIEYGFWHEPFPFKSKKLRDKYEWFMVVRNPYTRVISEFHSMHQLLISCFKGPYGGVGMKAGSYNITTFNNYIVKQIQHFHKNGWKMPGMPGHWGPQSAYLDPETRGIHILKFENLTDEFNVLMQEYSVIGRGGGLPVMSKDTAKPIGRREGLYANRMAKHFGVDDFNNTTLAMIHQLYRNDFTNFNYSMHLHSKE